MLTLYVTPVFYIYMDRLRQRLDRGKSKGHGAPERVAPVRARDEEPVPAAAALRSVES